MLTLSAESTEAVVDHIVVSVGPYMFHSESLREINCAARSRGSASPPLSTFESLLSHPASPNILQVDGVACIAVAALWAIASRRCAPSVATARLTSTTLPPT